VQVTDDTNPTELDFTGQVVLVTGGTKGLGKGICTAFSARRATVVTCGRNAPEPGTSDPAIDFVTCDVRNDDAVRALIDGIVARHGRLDVVVNNAGGSPHVMVAGSSPKFHQSIINLNLVAPLLVGMHANDVMQMQEHGGVIINVSSVAASRPSPGTAAYAAAKAGLESLTQSLAAEWAPKVRVNCVIAGLIRTEQSGLHYGDEAGIAAVSTVVPIGRMADPADLADVFVFLASPLARYMTGANVPVHGGGELPAFLMMANVNRHGG
jgi:NAD(P)-dependent dehydrogenase (short-subunit alcohol dehydrogenase family)